MNTENNTNHARYGDSTNDTNTEYCLFPYDFMLQGMDHPLITKIYEEQQNLTKQQ